MPIKLELDGLLSELTATSNLLESAVEHGDIVGELQLQQRVEGIKEEIERLKEAQVNENTASVALFFGGQPVMGSKGIEAKFAGSTLEQFQNLISKTYATSEMVQMGSRGKVPFKANSELMVTELARGSFGFVLDEMSEQTSIEASELSTVVDKVTKILRDVSDQDETSFESILEDLNPRTLIALQEFFGNLETNKATVRVVERDMDLTLDRTAVYRGKVRTEATTIEENSFEYEGVLYYLPDHRKFELKEEDGNTIYGSVSKEAADQIEKANQNVFGGRCLAKIMVKTVVPLNRPPRDVYRLLEILRFY